MATSLQWPCPGRQTHHMVALVLTFLWSGDWCQPHEISNMETIFSPSPGNHPPPPLPILAHPPCCKHRKLGVRLNSHLHVPLMIKNASWNHTMSFKIKWILNFGEICLNSFWGQKKRNSRGKFLWEIWWPEQETGGFMHHPRELERMSGLLFHNGKGPC